MAVHPHDKYMKANAAAWNEVTPIHKSYRKDEADFFRSGGITLDRIELEHLPELKGKEVAHLSCNCGQDTLSLSNLGARCTGFDISEKAIEEARNLASQSGINAEFVQINVLDIPEDYNSKFDLVYMSRGALVWLPDLKLLMKNISKILKKGGELFIQDQHPFVHLFDEDETLVTHNYFDNEPEKYYGLDYIGESRYEALPNYQYMVRLSDILSGMVENSLNLTLFLEHDRTFFKQFPRMIKDKDGFYRLPKYPKSQGIPLMMTLKAVKI